MYFVRETKYKHKYCKKPVYNLYFPQRTWNTENTLQEQTIYIETFI